MTHQPRRQETIRNNLQNSLEGSIPGVTNFTDESFNDVWLDAYGEEVRELEAKVVAAQLALWVDFAASDTLTQTDLESTGIDFTGWDSDEIDSFISDVNDLMEDVHLDRIGDLVGITRDSGSKATGKATITTASDSTVINEGLEVSTEPDADGNTKTFLVDADGDGDATGNETTTPNSGDTTVEVDIIAEDIGTEYNVGANTITFLPNPDPGIEDVNNDAETTGGTNEQSNENYRSELKNSVIDKTGGGTAAGVEGEVKTVSGVADVVTDEFQDEDPPHVDVVVEGGSDTNVENKIDEVKPLGIRHDLVRPETINLGFRIELVGSEIDDSFVQEQSEDFLTNLGLKDAFRRVKLIREILASDTNIEDIGAMTMLLTSVTNESEVFNTGTDKYTLDLAPLGHIEGERHLFKSNTLEYTLDYPNVLDNSDVEVTAMVNGDETVLTKDTDYFIRSDLSGVTGNDTISFDSSASGSDDGTAAGTVPDDRTVFEVEYDVHDDEVSSNKVVGTLGGTSDHEFTEGTDYDLIDDNADSHFDTIDWSIGGDSPDDGTRFFIDYDPKRVVLNDFTTSGREKIGLDGSKVSVTTTQPQ